MGLFFRKFGFIHRRLWERDGLYRAALLFGPAPVLGCMLAGVLWVAFQAVMGPSDQPPPWAVVRPATMHNASGGEPLTVQPTQPLPHVNADGSLTGYQPGWIVTAYPIVVSPTMSVEVQPSTVSGFNTFFLDGPDLDVERIIASGPKSPPYVGRASAYLVIREPGVYSLTARFDRQAGKPANCVMRLTFGSGRVVANVDLNLTKTISTTFDAVRFDLKPGLYAIFQTLSCWHEQEMAGPGRLTLLVGHPGEENPLPARPGDLVR